MKIKHFGIVLALTACTSSMPTAPVGREFSIAVGQTTEIDDTGLAITFVRVASDNRCPMGVLCIVAGNAQVELQATLNGAPTPLSLNTTAEPKVGIVSPYRITLTGLTPIPNIANPSGIEQKDYRASLVISSGGVVCTDLAAAGLGVSLSDSVSGATSGFTNVSVVARDGAYKDSVFTPAFPPAYGSVIALAYEHRGTVQVTVRADGYVPWVKNDIAITGDECHVHQVNVSARLVR